MLQTYYTDKLPSAPCVRFMVYRHRVMVSKFYKISHKSLGNNSVKSYSGIYVRKACIYINVFDEKKITAS